MTDRGDLTDDYHISANYQQPSVLPKVRTSNTANTSYDSNDSTKKAQLVPSSIPATPRMLRNSSGNFPPSPSQLQSSHRDPFNNQTPQRQGYDSSYKQQTSYGPLPTNPNPQYQSSAFNNQQQSPVRNNLHPIDTTSPNKTRNGGSPAEHSSKLLPPASVNQDQPNEKPSHNPQRTPSSKRQQPTQFHRRSIGDWDFMKTIGAGSMGKVKLAKHRKTNEICAIKIVPRAARVYARAHANDPAPVDSNEALARRKEYEKEVARDRRTIREASLGKILYHPFICRLFEVITMSNHFYMLFEYVSGGQMLDYIVSHGSLKERNARKFARGIGSSLDYLHKNNVVHRDLKIENIMISKSGDIKIIDFGLSNLFSNETLLKTYCGSLYFAAPELLCAHPYLGPEVDIWSFGVVLYVLVCGKVPFDDESVGVLHEKIKKGKVEYPEFLSPEVVSLLSRMLVVNPNKRASLSEVLSHPWMTKGYDLPPPSYIPHRIPLTLPLDSAVIKEMINLEFGQSEEQVTEDLNLIVSSDLYAEATKQFNKVKDHSGLKTNPTTGFHPLVSIYYLVKEMISRKHAKESIVDVPLPNPPPPQKDILDCPPAETQPLKETISEPAEMITPSLPPVLTFPEAVHTSPIHSTPPPISTNQQVNTSHTTATDELIQQQPRQKDDKGLNSILRKFSQKRSTSIRRSTDSKTKQYNSVADDFTDKQHAQDADEDILIRRVGSMKVTSKNTFEDQSLPLPNTASTEASASTVKTHNRAVSAYTGVQPSDTLQTVMDGPRKFHPTARAKSVGHRRDHAPFTANEVTQVPPLPADINEDAFFDDVTLDEFSTSSNPDKADLGNATSSKKYRFDLGELNEDQIVKDASKAAPGTMPSIEYPKTLFLKGLFSVQTTSTKPLPVIRANIISTLSKLGVKFTEVRGGFICVHTPSIEQPNIVITSDTDSQKGAEIQRQRTTSIKSVKSSSETNSTETGKLENKTTDDRSSYGDNSTDQQSTPSTKSHRRKFSLGGSILGYNRRKPSTNGPQIPNTPIASSNAQHLASPSARNYTGHDFDSSASLDSFGQGGSDMLISSRIEQNKVLAPTSTTGEDPNIVSAVPDNYKAGSAKISSASSRTPLKFEIHIVKVPLVGLFGVHLKKVTGNTWMYKTLAGQILSELNL